MSEPPPAADFWSRPFLLVWTLAPALLVLAGVARLHDFDPHLAVSFLALSLAGLWFPLELWRNPVRSFWPLGLLLLFLAPSWVAAGRLSGADWRGGISLAFVALWLALPWAVSRWKGGDPAARLRNLQALFFSLSALPPFLAFLSRNFGGEDWPRLAGLSPFTALLRLSPEAAGDWKTGAILSGTLFLASWIRARAAETEAP